MSLTEAEFNELLNNMSPEDRAANLAQLGMKTAVSPTPKNRSGLEIRMASILDRLSRELDFPAFEQEYQFDSSRRWAFDFALPDMMVAIEAEGGGWLRTKEGHGKGHLHPKRFERDCEKYNTATAAGWQVFRFTGDMIKDGRAEAFLRSIFPPF